MSLSWLPALPGDSRPKSKARSVVVVAKAPWRAPLEAALHEAGMPLSTRGVHVDAEPDPSLSGDEHQLRFSPTRAGGQLKIRFSTARGLAYAAETAAQLIALRPAKPLELQARPGFAVRGVVEGFYGRLWSRAERRALLAFMRTWRLNTYVYAPKNDPFHRELWRVPYRKVALRRLQDLAQAGREESIDLGFALSPGLSIEFGSEEDYQALLAKMRQFAGLGARIFGLYLDDVPSTLRGGDRRRFKSLAQAQVHLANRLLQALRHEVDGARLFFCPTEYRGAGDSDYLRELGSGLDPRIEIHWTGPQVVPRRIPRSDAETVAHTLRRPPLYWDNSPVNDALMTPELHLAAYSGRAPDLCEHASGILLNPMSQPLASRFALATAALYLWDPRTYDPAAAYDVALRELLPEEAREPFRLFACANAASMMPPGGPAYPTAVVKRVRRLQSRERFEEARALGRSEAERMRDAVRALQRHLPRPLLREVRPWLDEFAGWAALALRGVELEEGFAQLASAPSTMARAEAYLQTEAALRELRWRLARTIELRTTVCGGALRSHLIELCQRIDGLIRAMSPLPESLRPLLSGIGWALPRAEKTRE
jgi:hyaluronoglucosaminidase